MDQLHYRSGQQERASFSRRCEWRFTEKNLLILLYITCLILQTKCQTLIKNESSQKSITKSDLSNVDLKLVNPLHCHNCHPSSKSRNLFEGDQTNNINETNKKDSEDDSFLDEVLDTFEVITEKYYQSNNETKNRIQREVETFLDTAMKKDRYEIIEGVEIKTIANKLDSSDPKAIDESRSLFKKFTYEYRLLQKIKNFVDTHILSISLPKAARLMGFRCKYFHNQSVGN